MYGSSQLATTAAPGLALTTWRRTRSTPRISPTRSSWPRLRLSSTITLGRVCAATCARCSSSTSSTPYGASGAPINALRCPSGMLAPVVLVATVLIDRSASVIINVLVVLPLVPVTSTTSRPRLSLASARWSSAVATRPPMMAPSPTPSRREDHAASLPSRIAPSPQFRERTVGRRLSPESGDVSL
ncbi:hypothetical protein AOZ06_14770 [Kibdelosporangium phytohabitans]|uniref:Uncharacterized protein n=1 Tax=Kibdelosporangium phytohabitans TaxID=860235 RepID=A0A0N9HSU7_9PSEU|nr:hypothetical protein AOZ06_14770 [Kibdelosporangium phytohabitans]